MMEDLKIIVARNMVDLRKSRSITQADLAERLNYSDKAVSKWERGESMPDVTVLKNIADFYGVTVDYLLSPAHSEPEKIRAEHGFDAYRSKRLEKILITWMSFFLVWVIGVFVFAMLALFASSRHGIWITFVYAVPASFIVLLVLNSVWFSAHWNFPIISGLMWTCLTAIYISLLVFASVNMWLLFLPGIPGQVIILLWWRLWARRKKRLATTENN